MIALDAERSLSDHTENIVLCQNNKIHDRGPLNGKMITINSYVFENFKHLVRSFGTDVGFSGDSFLEL